MADGATMLRQAEHDADESDRSRRPGRLRRQVRALDLATPVLTGTLVVLAARASELQWVAAVAQGSLHRITAGAREAVAHARDNAAHVLLDKPLERLHDLADNGRTTWSGNTRPP